MTIELDSDELEVRLAYGSSGLVISLPAASTTVVTPAERRGASDARAAITTALRSPINAPPLRELVRRGDRVAIAICDGTRPQPRDLVVPAILDELAGIVEDRDVVVLVATGTHRANSADELAAMLPAEVLRRVAVVNHDARDDGELVSLGVAGAGVPVQLNRRWVEADVRITTGFVEPHFFAGFSGGPKLVAPGLAGLETTLVLHDARRIGDANATFGVTDGNPVHDDVRAIAAATGVHFSCDVVLNRAHEVVEAFAGELFAMHAAACAASRAAAMQPVAQRFEVVVTTNAGFPLDQNLYQTAKGMAAAAGVVTPGGLIIVAAECRDGFPDHGLYKELLFAASGPAELLERIEQATTTQPDQWQVQVQAKVQAFARVGVHAEGLSSAELRRAHLEVVDDIAATVRGELARAGAGARCCVLPNGPETVPYLVGELV